MKEYEHLDHTADVKFRAYGKNFEEALKNLIKAVYGVIVEPETIEEKKEKKIIVKGRTKENIVYELIEEIIFLLDTEGFLGKKAKEIKLKEEQGTIICEATIIGDDEPKKYDVFGQIKSATYHEMMINEEKGKVFIQAVLDI